MHDEHDNVGVDLNWLFQFIISSLAVTFTFYYLLRTAASRFFVLDSNFSDRNSMAAEVSSAPCVVCGVHTTKQCSGCKIVKYCSGACQKSHWSEHKAKCLDLRNHTKSTSILKESRASVVRARRSKILKQSNEILFPYEQFVDLFNWDKPDYPPCGLLNCGNSCFANVVLQCLAYTRPLAAYLLEKGHRTECQMDNWCFLCEFQTHVERASRSRTPFSPINILSRLPNIGGSLGHGEQEDSHEFMRFAIDAMQSVCLDEFGGEKAVHPSYQETTLIQHIFGGHLQSQVICTECDNVSSQIENMMDLSVEIHGDAESLEECLDQFTAKEWLHGDNMYKCDSCNAYVKAWKRLTIRRAPNILTIALKRFQSGRFGKLNKRVTFPETLDLSPYTSELEDGNDIYKLYAVIVHLDLLNASYFGHYICYIKGFCGNWFRIDDCKVACVDLDEVLSQGAYMLMYRRNRARPSCLLPAEPQVKQVVENVKLPIDPSPEQATQCLSTAGCLDSPVESDNLSNANHSAVEVNCDRESSSVSNAENASVDINGKHLVDDSLIDNISMQLDGHGFQQPLISGVENGGEGEGSEADANEGVMRIEIEECTENGIFEKSGGDGENGGEGSEADANKGVMRMEIEECTENGIFGKSNGNGENGGEGSEADANKGVMRMEIEECTENCIFDISNGNGENGGEGSEADANEGVMRMKIEECTENGILEKSNGNGDAASHVSVTNIEILDRVGPTNSTSILKNGEFGKVDETKDAAKKSNRETKLKPIFARGFLEKNSRKVLIKQAVELSVHLNNQTNDGLISENGSLLKDEKQGFVLENGSVCSESGPRKRPENGDCGHPIASG